MSPPNQNHKLFLIPLFFLPNCFQQLLRFTFQCLDQIKETWIFHQCHDFEIFKLPQILTFFIKKIFRFLNVVLNKFTFGLCKILIKTKNKNPENPKKLKKFYGPHFIKYFYFRSIFPYILLAQSFKNIAFLNYLVFKSFQV